MAVKDPGRIVDDIAHELDMVVYRLERDAPDDAAAAARERQRLRRDLERLVGRLKDLARDL